MIGLELASASKITSSHLDRLAFIYVRQSSPRQVERNRESQEYQYKLSDRALQLGWSESNIKVIDCDQGLTGAESQHREGFQELMAAVSLGRAGIIFGYEVSRLARNNSDWHRLLEVAAICDTLIADADGIYDPRINNDRMLLGLKGTISEVELHTLKSRLAGGRLNQVERGEYHQQLPTGLIRQPDGTVVKDPDTQTQSVLQLVFTKFAELGSGLKVLRYLQREHVLLPSKYDRGHRAEQTSWAPPTTRAIYRILHNPAYAGAFAYGREQRKAPSLQAPRPGVRRLKQPMQEWIQLKQGVYPAYISWEEYLANQERLLENSTLFMNAQQHSRGPAREGQALLQGMVVCSDCGRRLQIRYTRTHRYLCPRTPSALPSPGPCRISIHGPVLDQAITRSFFEALKPAKLDVLDAVLEKQTAEQRHLDQLWQQQLRRAEYEAHLAWRQYDKVDPDNRLVADELERRLQEKLEALDQIKGEYIQFQQQRPQPKLTPEQRQQFKQLSKHLPVIWEQLDFAQRKELLRALIIQINVKRIASNLVEARIIWISGHCSIEQVRLPSYTRESAPDYPELVSRISQLVSSGQDSDEAIAAQLTAEGFHSARTQGVTSSAVKKIRLSQGWSRSSVPEPGWLTPIDLSQKLGVPRSWVYQQIHSDVIGPAYLKQAPPGQPWLIKDDPGLLARLKSLAQAKSRS